MKFAPSNPHPAQSRIPGMGSTCKHDKSAGLKPSKASVKSGVPSGSPDTGTAYRPVVPHIR